MGIEAFVIAYKDCDVAPLRFDRIRNIFADFTVDWQPANGVLRVCFGDEINSCDIYCGRECEVSNSTRGLMISRPVQHPELWRCVLDVMRMGNVVLFFSDDSTPLFAAEEAPRHLPADLLESLGKPRIVQCPDDITRDRDGGRNVPGEST